MEPQGILPVVKRTRKTKPDIRAIKTLQYINQGESVRAAQIKAGYSVKTASRSTKFFKNKGVQRAIQSMKGFLEDVGLTNLKMASKIAEFVDAKKVDHSHTEPDKVVPDYRTQIEGVKLWNEVLDRNSEGQKGKIKQQLTVTQFVTGEDE